MPARCHLPPASRGAITRSDSGASLPGPEALIALRRHRALLVTLSGGLALAALIAGCAGGQPGSMAAAATSPATIPAVEVVAQGVGGVAARVRDAVDGLVEVGRIRVSYRVAGAEGATTEGEGTVDLAARAYDLAEHMTADGVDFTHVRRLVGDTLYVRDVFAGVDPASVPWTEVSRAAGVRELAGALTARGRALPSLERLVLLVERLPFIVGGGERMAPELLLTVPAETIADFYRETGLQHVGDWDESMPDEGHLHDAPDVAFGLAFDARGALAGLRASGTVFHDGEMLEGASIEIDYMAAPEAAAVTAPSGSGA